MSLADFYHKVNVSGADLFSEKHGRIMRDASLHNQLQTKQEADKSEQQIAHMRLYKENITGQINQLKREIVEGRQAGYPSSLLAEKEKMLHRLQSDHLHIMGEISKAQGRTDSASFLRFHTPRYF